MLDLGNLTIGLELDERPFDRSMTNVEKRADNLEKKLSGAKKIDVAPTGTRELDNASKSADGLKRGLDQAAASSGKVKAPTGLDASLAKSAGSADNLASSLDQAAREASELGGSAGGVDQVSTALGGAVNMAKNLVPALSAAATATTVFTKGWDRLTSIDNAQFKLQGLGHTAESTASIMNSAMESVSGTAYGFGDAASLAAGVVAATGAEGERLTEILTTVADTAAISGRSLGDIGLIFNQVAASGTLMGDDLNQLMDSGIPVLQFLSNELGIAASEIKDLASEGEISFEMLESAMRNNLGGAAQEMGGSVTGALSNVGAAFGRLGAEIMSGGFSALPDVIGGVTAGVDLLTDGMGALNDVFGSLPGPVKNTAVALGLLVASQKLLNTEIGDGGSVMDRAGRSFDGFRDKVGGVRTSIGQWSTSIRRAYVDGSADLRNLATQHTVTAQTSMSAAAKANASMKAEAATFRATAAGVTSAVTTGIGGAARGLLGVLGGPWGLALTGASAALGLFMNHVNNTRQAQEEAEASTNSWADALTNSAGKIDDAVAEMALDKVINSEYIDQIKEVGLGYDDVAAAVLNLDGGYDQMIEKLREVAAANSEVDEAAAAFGATGERSYNQTGEAALDLIEGLQQMHGEYAAGAELAAETEEATGGLAEQIANAADQSGKAAPRFNDTGGVLQEFAGDAKSADDAIDNLANAMMGLSEDPAIRLQSYIGEAAQSLRDFKEAAEDGKGGLDPLTGMFDTATEQGMNMHSTLTDVRENMYQLAAATMETSMQQGDSYLDATEKARVASEGQVQAFRDSAAAMGYNKEEIDALVESYGLIPDRVLTEIEIDTKQTVVETLNRLDTAMANVARENHTITVDSDALDMTAEKAEELGFLLEEDELAGVVQLTAETELAKAAVEEIADRTEEVTEDNDIVFRGDTQAFLEDIQALGTETDELKAELADPAEIAVYMDTSEARNAAQDLGLEVETLPGGYIYVEDNTHESHQNLVDLGAEAVGLPSGHVVITDTSDENIRALQGLGITTTTLPNGDVVILDDSKTARERIEENMSNMNWIGRATVDIVQRVRNVFGGSDEGNYRGGLIPRLARGDRTHGGYRLPMTGPGTDKTDGILGMDAQGLATSWVDRGEYVTNRAATEQWLHTLEAINANDTVGVVQSVLRHLPRLADGGTTTGGAALPAGTGNVQVDMSADAEVNLNAVGVSDELAIIGQQLEEVGQGETITLDAVSDEAMAALDSVGLQTTELPDGSVEVTTHTDQSLDALAVVSEGLHELGDTEINPQVLFDTTEIEVNAEQAQELLDALAIEEPTPTAQLIIDDLVAGKGIAVGELEFLHSMSPTPAADINTALLEAGVALSEAELQRVGNSKATSVVDVNNQSALQNVQATLNALDTMPVERVIRIVAAGSAASAISNRQYGGQIPKNATGGRLPTSGPGTHTTDGILGVDADGVPTSWVDRGEWVVNRGRSERFNKTLNAINGGSVNEIVAAIRSDIPNMQALAEGGVVSPEQLLDFAAGQIVNGEQASRSLQGAPYVWGGINWGDCSGAMSGLANFAKGLAPFASRFATGNQREALAAMGFVAGLGDPSTSFNLGWFNGGPWGGHTAGDIGGTAVEMGGGAGGQGKIGGAAASASSSQFTDHAHLTLGELWAFDYFNRTGPHGFTYQPAPDPSWQTEGGRGMSPGGEGLAVVNGLGGGVSHTGGDGIHLNNGMVIPFNNGRMYDTGGLWPKGTWGFNNIGDELVLPPRETEQFQALPDAAEAMYMVAAELSALHPEVAKAVDELLPLAEQGLVALDEGVKFMEAAADPNSVEGLTARGTARGVLGWDILPYTEQLTSIMDAEQELTESRADYEARTVAITDAQDELAQAKQELHELETASTDMSVQDARKLADAQKAVDEAKADAAQASGDKQAAAAEKVADSEEKLRRVREDIAAGAEEDAIKRAEDIAKATDQVAEAEVNLTEKRMDAVAALDHIDVGDYLRGLVPGINGAIGALNGLQGSVGSLGGVIPQLTGVLGQAAAVAGSASMPLGVAIQMVSTGIDVARQVYEIFETIIDGASEAKAEVASMAATGASSMREWSQAVDAQRQTVAQLSISVRQLQMDVQRAAWDSAQAARDVGRAQLDASVQVAQAQARLAEERRTQQEEWDAQARANYWSNEDLSLSYDRLRWAQEESIDGVLDTQREATPEMIALQNEIYAAQYAAAVSVLDAEIAALNASYALAEAQKALARGQDELTKAVQRFNAMQNSAYGFSTPEAMTGEEIARLRAENARLQGEINNPGNRIGNFLDFDGDGKVFWLLDNAGSQVTQSAQAMIDANNRRIAELESSQYAPQYSDDQRAEMDRAMEWASNAWARGDEDTARIIMDSAFGEWTRALEDQAFNQQIWDWEDSWTEIQQMAEDMDAAEQHQKDMLALEQKRDQLQAGANANQYYAEGSRAESAELREAFKALADYEAARATASTSPKNVTINGNHFNAEQMANAITSLYDGQGNLNVRLNALEAPDRISGSDLMAAKRR